MILTENNKLITNQNEVSEVFKKNSLKSVANDIGKGLSFDEKNHPRSCNIKEKLNPELSFNC